MIKMLLHRSTLFSLLVVILISCNSKNAKENTAYSSKTKPVDSLLASAVNNAEIPGVVAFIIRNDTVLYNKAFGWRNIENKVTMKEDDIFRMASMTKGLTAVSVLQLVERGMLDLDDDVSKYIPEFKNPQVLVKVLPDSSFISRPAKSGITIRQLLTHTSGIGYGFQNEMYNALIIKNNISEGFEDDSRTSLENIHRLAGIPLLYEPGERYTYSMSYDVLSVVIENISGLRFDKYVAKYILDPLGMQNSYFVIPKSQQYRLVTVYQPAENGIGIESSTYPDNNYPLIETRKYFSGGADLCSTASDYAKFVMMVLNRGSLKNVRILGEKYIDMMLSKQTGFDDGDSDQGFAAWITNSRGAAHGLMSEGSFGFGGFYDTYSWADRKKNFVAVLLLQMYPENQCKIHQKFQKTVYGIIDEL